MNRFDTRIVLDFTSSGDDPETFHATGTIGNVREFCDWLDGCLRDLSDTAYTADEDAK